MAKKDFSTDTNSVFDSFFSKPAESVNNENKLEKAETKQAKKEKDVIKEIIQETKLEEPIKVQEPVIAQTVETTPIKEIAPKTQSKENRYNFFVDNELTEYVKNITWIKRQKNVAMYMNSLIKKDLLDFLNRYL